jgi:hypothetical protein
MTSLVSDNTLLHAFVTPKVTAVRAGLAVYESLEVVDDARAAPTHVLMAGFLSSALEDIGLARPMAVTALVDTLSRMKANRAAREAELKALDNGDLLKKAKKNVAAGKSGDPDAALVPSAKHIRKKWDEPFEADFALLFSVWHESRRDSTLVYAAIGAMSRVLDREKTSGIITQLWDSSVRRADRPKHDTNAARGAYDLSPLVSWAHHLTDPDEKKASWPTIVEALGADGSGRLLDAANVAQLFLLYAYETRKLSLLLQSRDDPAVPADDETPAQAKHTLNSLFGCESVTLTLAGMIYALDSIENRSVLKKSRAGKGAIVAPPGVEAFDQLWKAVSLVDKTWLPAFPSVTSHRRKTVSVSGTTGKETKRSGAAHAIYDHAVGRGFCVLFALLNRECKIAHDAGPADSEGDAGRRAIAVVLFACFEACAAGHVHPLIALSGALLFYTRHGWHAEDGWTEVEPPNVCDFIQRNTMLAPPKKNVVARWDGQGATVGEQKVLFDDKHRVAGLAILAQLRKMVPEQQQNLDVLVRKHYPRWVNACNVPYVVPDHHVVVATTTTATGGKTKKSATKANKTSSSAPTTGKAAKHRATAAAVSTEPGDSGATQSPAEPQKATDDADTAFASTSAPKHTTSRKRKSRAAPHTTTTTTSSSSLSSSSSASTTKRTKRQKTPAATEPTSDDRAAITIDITGERGDNREESMDVSPATSSNASKRSGGKRSTKASKAVPSKKALAALESEDADSGRDHSPIVVSAGEEQLSDFDLALAAVIKAAQRSGSKIIIIDGSRRGSRHTSRKRSRSAGTRSEADQSPSPSSSDSDSEGAADAGGKAKKRKTPPKAAGKGAAPRKSKPKPPQPLVPANQEHVDLFVQREMDDDEYARVNAAPMTHNITFKNKKENRVLEDVVMRGGYSVGNQHDVLRAMAHKFTATRIANLGVPNVVVPTAAIHRASGNIYLEWPNIGTPAKPYADWETTEVAVVAGAKLLGVPRVVARQEAGVVLASDVLADKRFDKHASAVFVDMLCRSLFRVGHSSFTNYVLSLDLETMVAVDHDEKRDAKNLTLDGPGSHVRNIITFLFSRAPSTPKMPRVYQLLREPETLAAMRALLERVEKEDMESLKATAKAMGYEPTSEDYQFWTEAYVASLKERIEAARQHLALFEESDAGVSLPPAAHAPATTATTTTAVTPAQDAAPVPGGSATSAPLAATPSADDKDKHMDTENTGGAEPSLPLGATDATATALDVTPVPAAAVVTPDTVAAQVPVAAVTLVDAPALPDAAAVVSAAPAISAAVSLPAPAVDAMAVDSSIGI